MHFTGNDGYQNFPVFAPMLNSLILHRNKKTTNWISTGISSENIKAFNNNLEPTISNSANGKVIFKFINSVLVLNIFFSLLYSNFILNLWIVFKFINSVLVLKMFFSLLYSNFILNL